MVIKLLLSQAYFRSWLFTFKFYQMKIKKKLFLRVAIWSSCAYFFFHWVMGDGSFFAIISPRTSTSTKLLCLFSAVVHLLFHIFNILYFMCPLILFYYYRQWLVAWLGLLLTNTNTNDRAFLFFLFLSIQQSKYRSNEWIFVVLYAARNRLPWSL